MRTTNPLTGHRLFLAGALLGASAILLGAFAAHGLQGQLGPRPMAVFAKAVDYQAMHAPVLLLIGWLQQSEHSIWLIWAGRLLLAGTLLFSGSLYLLALSGLGGIGWITPIGGTALVCGWLCLLKAWPARGK
jgi:uncharacterized membrane protein YgdD (TMEM256/DUF423 family)